MKLPIGRLGSFSPERARRMASDTASTALSWPMTRSCSASSMCSSFSASPSSMRLTGMPVMDAISSAMSCSVTVMSVVWVFAHSALAPSYSAWISSTCCRMRAAAS